MRGQNICFLEKEEKSSLNYPQYSLLSGALIRNVTGLLHNIIMTPNIQEYLSLKTVDGPNYTNLPPFPSKNLQKLKQGCNFVVSKCTGISSVHL